MSLIMRATFLVVYTCARVYRVLANKTSSLLHLAVLKRVGTGTKFQRGIWISDPGSVQMGRNCFVAKGTIFSAELTGAKCMFGDDVQINSGCFLDHTGDLTLEDGVLISEHSKIYTHDHGSDPRSIPVAVPKRIAENAWIGANSILLPGCRYVGKRAIIGAGSIVTKDVPDFAIVAGSPAIVLGQNFADHD